VPPPEHPASEKKPRCTLTVIQLPFISSPDTLPTSQRLKLPCVPTYRDKHSSVHTTCGTREQGKCCNYCQRLRWQTQGLQVVKTTSRTTDVCPGTERHPASLASYSRRNAAEKNGSETVQELAKASVGRTEPREEAERPYDKTLKSMHTKPCLSKAPGYFPRQSIYSP